MISLIVAVYNTEVFLRQCLESIVNQTYKDIEVIIIDDGSTDRSGLICDQYCEEYEHLKCYHIQNEGLAHGRKLGLSKAKGEYICFIDSDDWLEVDYCKIMLQSIEEHNADVCVCDFFRNEKVENCWQPIVIQKKEDIYDEYFKNGILNRMWNKMFRREVIRDNIFSEGRDMLEDAFWMPQTLIKIKTLARVSNPLYHYRVREGSIMTKKKTYKEKKGMILNSIYKVKFFYSDAEHIKNIWLISLFEKEIREAINSGYFMDNDIYHVFQELYQSNQRLIDQLAKECDFISNVAKSARTCNNPGCFYRTYLCTVSNAEVDKKKLVLQIIQKKILQIKE